MSRLEVVERLEGFLDDALVPLLLVAWAGCGVVWVVGEIRRRRRVLSDPAARVVDAEGDRPGADPGKDAPP